jgi:hypothetical protein
VVIGNLASLRDFRNLRALNLPPAVSGDVANLEAGKDLRLLVMDDCADLSGNISVAKNFKDILVLVIRSQRIFGSFTAFESLRLLETLDLVGSSIARKLEDFPRRLEVLRATNVSGDLSTLDDFPYLREATLSGLLSEGVLKKAKARVSVFITRTQAIPVPIDIETIVLL